MAKIEAGNAAIYAIGRIEYEDFTGEKRWTSYVYFSSGSEYLVRGLMTAYKDGNDAV